jgi:hypothetical protein
MLRAEDEVHDALSDELARIGPAQLGPAQHDSGQHARFTVAEFGAAGATIWRVYRDENGTPRAEQPRVRAAAMKDRDAFYREVDPAFIVRAGTPDELPDELVALLPNPAGGAAAPVYECRTPLEDLVREAIRDSPLLLGYELAVLRQVPSGRDRPDGGRLVLTGQPLFPPGVTQGHRAVIRVRCEPAAEGTVFAVVTRDRRPDVPPSVQELRPVHVQTAPVPGDTYELTAVLTRPGRVQLQGLPGPLSHFSGSWDDLRLRVPERLSAPEPVHLVCLVEVSGGDDVLELRIDRLSQLIDAAETGERPLRVSVVAYGPHSVAWAVDEEPVAVRAWAGPSSRAEQELRGLSGRKTADREYRRAAQLECALETVARHLAGSDGRPVLVTAGGRPPHPPAMDARSTLIPCPDRVNWKWQLDRIGALRATFGALRDAGARGEAWPALGQHAAGTVDDPVDMADFALRLGLREAAQAVPFPFID